MDVNQRPVSVYLSLLGLCIQLDGKARSHGFRPHVGVNKWEAAAPSPGSVRAGSTGGSEAVDQINMQDCRHVSHHMQIRAQHKHIAKSEHRVNTGDQNRVQLAHHAGASTRQVTACTCAQFSITQWLARGGDITGQRGLCRGASLHGVSGAQLS